MKIDPLKAELCKVSHQTAGHANPAPLSPNHAVVSQSNLQLPCNFIGYPVTTAGGGFSTSPSMDTLGNPGQGYQEP